MESKLATAASVLPVTLEEIKAMPDIGLVSKVTTHNDTLTNWLKSSVALVEELIGRALISQTWDAVFPSWIDFLWEDYENAIPRVLPNGQIQSITSIIYKDEDGVNQTVSTDYYTLKIDDPDAGRVVMIADSNDDEFDYPDLYEYDTGRITVKYVCGYGDAAASVPFPIKAAIMLKSADLFNGSDQARAINALLDNYRLRTV